MIKRSTLQDVVGCDPDTAHPTYAYVRARELQSIHWAESPRVRPPYPREVLLCLEAQYLAEGGKAPPKDILALTYAAGQSSMHFDTCEEVTPIRWKGNADKANHQRWTWTEMSEAERFVCKGLPKYKLVEVLDAVGLALWAVGRLR